MGSYSQHLPKLGGASTLEAPFFFPSTSAPSNELYYRGRSSGDSLESRGDFVSQANNYKHAVARRSTSSETITGRGVLTHLITPKSASARRYSFRVVVDNKDTYTLTIPVSGDALGVFGGFLIGKVQHNDATQEGVCIRTSSFIDGEKAVLSPLDTAQRGIGIPFESSITVTKIAGDGEVTSDFIVVAHRDTGTITKES